MENKYKEYGSVIIITILHGIFTYKFLGGMPHISFDTFKGASVNAFFMWMIYGMILCFILEKWVLLKKNIFECCISTIVFGGISAVAKGGIDFIIGRLGAKLQDVIKIAYMVQTVTVLFGMVIICVLIFCVAKKRIYFDVKRIKIPICILGSIVLLNILSASNYFNQYQKAVQEYAVSEEVKWKLNYYFGGKILDINVWFYVLFYIAFWWFMRRLTEDSEEKFKL